MEKITTASRIHPLMAAAALSVITVSAVGTAAIAGWLPHSQAQTPAPLVQAQVAQVAPVQPMQAHFLPAQSSQMLAAPAVVAATPAQQLLEAQQLLAAQQTLTAQQQQQLHQQQKMLDKPVVVRVVEAPKAKAKPRPVRVVYRDAPQRTRSYARRDNTSNYQAQAPAPQPRQPNYVGIGTGAVIGGLIGNQIGGGNGKKLATVAGIIGGGYLGNEIANRNQR